MWVQLEVSAELETWRVDAMPGAGAGAEGGINQIKRDQ